jgi:hypothetical protein
MKGRSDLLERAAEIAREILTDKIDLETACENLRQIYIGLDFPEEFKDWMYLADGHSDEYYDSSWIPGVTVYNHEKWIATVKRKAFEILELWKQTQ